MGVCVIVCLGCPVLVFRIGLRSLALLVLAFRRRKSFGACVCLCVCAK